MMNGNNDLWQHMAAAAAAGFGYQLPMPQLLPSHSAVQPQAFHLYPMAGLGNANSAVAAATPRPIQEKADEIAERLKREISENVTSALESFRTSAQGACLEISSNVAKLCGEATESLKEKKNEILYVASQCERSLQEISRTSFQKISETLEHSKTNVQSEISTFCTASVKQVEDSVNLILQEAKSESANVQSDVKMFCIASVKQVEDSVKLILQEAKSESDNVQSELKEFCTASVTHVEDSVKSILVATESSLSELKSSHAATTEKRSFWDQVNGDDLMDQCSKNVKSTEDMTSSTDKSASCKPFKLTKERTFLSSCSKPVKLTEERSSCAKYSEDTSLIEPICVNDSGSDSELEAGSTSARKDNDLDSKKKLPTMQLSDVKKLLSEKCQKESIKYETRTNNSNRSTQPHKKRPWILSSDDEDDPAQGSDEGQNGIEELRNLTRHQLSKIKKDDLIEKIVNESNSDEEPELEPGTVCQVCLEGFVEEVTLPCGHSFCKVCLQEWHKVKVSCPLCRDQPDFVMY